MNYVLFAEETRCERDTKTACVAVEFLDIDLIVLWIPEKNNPGKILDIFKEHFKIVLPCRENKIKWFAAIIFAALEVIRNDAFF